eukprot:179055-Alexandrium_andersonii.AAC.1
MTVLRRWGLCGNRSQDLGRAPSGLPATRRHSAPEDTTSHLDPESGLAPREAAQGNRQGCMVVLMRK